MQNQTKDFLKETFWNDKKLSVERMIVWWDWSKENPFVLIRQEFNDYVWDEARIMRLFYGDYNKKQQRLIDYKWKSMDEIDIIYIEDDNEKKRTVYFDLSEVF
jgi:hypothetical protein